MENKCENCAYYCELKQAHELGDSTKIYGYCYAEDVKKSEGRAVYQPDGCCEAFKGKEQHWVCWACRDEFNRAYFTVEGYKDGNEKPWYHDTIDYSRAWHEKVADNAYSWLITHGSLPRFYLKQKPAAVGYSKPALMYDTKAIKGFSPINILLYLRIDRIKVKEWFNTAKVGDHYDGEGFTIDVEEYSIPGWEVRKKEDAKA